MPGMISNASSAVGNVSLLNGHTQLKGKTILYDSALVSDAVGVLRTVTAGKTYYLLTATLKINSTETNKIGEIFITNTGSMIIELSSMVETTYLPRYTQTIVFAPAFPIPIAAGLQIKVSSSAATLSATGTLIGWEE